MPTRWGGEESIVLALMTSKAIALLPARRIIQSVADHAFTGMGDKKVTVCIGIADLYNPVPASTQPVNWSRRLIKPFPRQKKREEQSQWMGKDDNGYENGYEARIVEG